MDEQASSPNSDLSKKTKWTKTKKKSWRRRRRVGVGGGGGGQSKFRAARLGVFRDMHNRLLNSGQVLVQNVTSEAFSGVFLRPW
jgi:hypothetical protein